MALTVFITSASDVLPWAARRMPSLASVVIPSLTAIARRSAMAAPRFNAAANRVRLQLFVLAYNLGNFLRQAVLPRAVRHWTLTTLREKLIKIGAKVVRHSR